MMKLALGLATGMMLTTAAMAGDLVVMDDTTGGPTWQRPLSGFPPAPPLSGAGNATPYQVFEFSVTANGSYDFLSEADGWDNYLHL